MTYLIQIIRICIVLTALILYQFFSYGQQSKIDSLQLVYQNATDEEVKEDTRYRLYRALIKEADRLLSLREDLEHTAQLYEQAGSLRANGVAFYNAACSWALAGNSKKAFINLDKAYENGYRDIEWMKNDEDLNSLHSNEKWIELIEREESSYVFNKNLFYWGLYYGILCILIIYNLFLFFSIKERSFLFYSLFLFVYLNIELSRTNQFSFYLVDIFIWMKYLDPESSGFLFFASLITIPYLFFVKSFLSLKNNLKQLDKIYNAIIILSTLLVFVSYIFDLPSFLFVLILNISLLIFPLGTGIYLWIKKINTAKYFVIANMFFVIGGVITFLNAYGIFDLEEYILKPDNIGSLAFFSLLSIALGNKIKTLKKDKIEAQEKALLVLEEKVQERTEEVRLQSEEIKSQNEEISAQRDMVIKQKEEIEDNHQHISDSIDYATRIQASILPNENLLKEHLTDYFVFYLPKDKVSGDFYWWTHIEGHTVITAADCTGHGVPGAFMSMLGVSFLREIVNKEYITHPGVILRRLRKEIVNSLRQKGGETGSQDGMDMALISIDQETGKMQFAGANNPLYLIRKNKLIQNNDKIVEINMKSEISDRFLYEIKPDRMPIAIYLKMDKFTTHELDLEKGDMIYLFSDGFADQFGGAQERKFKYKPFKQLLYENADRSMFEQKIILEKAFYDWKGGIEQVDDVIVLGIKI